MKLDVVFVCQQGELEAQAALLAASLRKYCDNQVVLHAITPIPEEEYGTVSPVTKKFLDDLGVKWYHFKNPISDDYKVFNKLNAFNIRPEGDRILFLDSDIIVRRSLQGLSAYFSRPFAAKCGYKQAFSASAEDWKPVYQLFDLPVPAMRWPASDTYQWGPPYFNAAAILVDPALDFSKHWIDTCLRIHQDEPFWTVARNKNHGTVQLGLPIVLARRNIPYALLDGRFNLALSRTRVRKLCAWADNEGYIFHYTNPTRMLKDPFLPHEVNALVQSFKLEEVFSLLPAWRKFLVHLEQADHHDSPNKTIRPHSSLFTLQAENGSETPSVDKITAKPPARQVDRSLESRMVFITGIPYGGARRFSSLFAQLPNVAVLNEPDVKDDFLRQESLDGFGATWKKWREEIDRDGSIPGLLAAGKTRAQTIQDDRQRFIPPEQNSNYVLATQQTLGYLPRLEEIQKTFPEATIFVIVRNPFATIASWMALPHLQDGKIVEQDEWTGMHAPHLSPDQQEHLAALHGVDDPAMKRAGLWDYFAGLANTHAEQIHILSYESIIENPRAVLEHAYKRLFPGLDFEWPNIDLHHIEHEAHGMLTEWDKECIRAACSNNAGAFGYNLYEF